jgi:two-component system, NarL family, sensor histidine kinase UhpB
VLYRTDQQAKQEIKSVMESTVRQLEVQLMRIDSGFESASNFPDLNLWQEAQSTARLCIRFISEHQNFTQGVCHGTRLPDYRWPELFEVWYQRLFNTGAVVSHQVSYHGKTYGSVWVTSNVEMELARAWESLLALFELATLIVVSNCLLIYGIVRNALGPAQVIVSDLEKMRAGNLAIRSTEFSTKRMATHRRCY